MNAALLLTALFNGAWQGAALCALAYLVLRTQRRLNATTMFAVWSVLLGIALALPAANYVFAARPYTLHVAAARQASTHAERRVAAPVAKKQAPAVTAAAATSMAAPRPSIAQIGLAALTWLLDRAGLMLLVVAAIAALRVTLLVRDVFGMFAARRSARRIELPFAPCGSIRRAYAIAASRDLK
jgi:hypothetical protein